MRNTFLAIAILFMSGCCMFAPCHRGTELIGYVKDTNEKPIKNAKVTLYGYSVETNSNGCFYFNEADALPFELSIEAIGYTPVTSKAKWGKFIVKVVLSPESKGQASKVIWEETNSDIEKCT